MNRKRAIFVLLFLAVAAIALWYAFGFKDSERAVASEVVTVPRAASPNAVPPETRPAPSSGAVQHGVEAASGADGRAANPAAAALPPIDAPLREILADLKARADAGDRRAACRVAHGLGLCLNQEKWKALSDGYRRMSTSRGTEEERRELDEKQRNSFQWDALALKTCSGIGNADYRDAFRYQMMAAESGDVESTLQLAFSPPLDPKFTGRDIDLWEQYRDRVPYLVESAAMRGDPRAMVMLSLALRGFTGVMSNLQHPYPNDPVRAVAYAMVVRNFNDPELNGPADSYIEAQRSKLSVSQFGEAQAMSNQLFAEKFRDVPASREHSGEHYLSEIVEPLHSKVDSQCQ